MAQNNLNGKVVNLPVLVEVSDISPKIISEGVEERARCPFYGFSFLMGMLTDTNGNQCALVTEAGSPCYMKIGGQKPDWDGCRYNTDEMRRTLQEKGVGGRVFPDKFRPTNLASWEGISFSGWYEHIMGRPLEISI